MAVEVFVDTGVWYGAANPKDAHHRACVGALHEAVEQGDQPATTNLVLAETHAMLLRWVNRSVALAFLQEARGPQLVIVTSTPELEGRALRDWIERYDDQDFSLADAVSFAVMAARGIKEALTLDHHFRVAGFRTRP